ncbi:MAG: polysaccharide biosynthesis protein [Acidobacteriales bacterium]|nr:polysaccharide biosynthesis protein [Terriglobales bacterium]
MSLVATIRRDVALKFTGEVLSRALFLGFFFYLGRRMGSVDFGTLNLAISTAYILGVLFLDGGLNLPAIQLLVSEKHHRQVVASSVFTAKLLLYVPMCLVLWGVSRFLGGGTPAMSLLLIASLYVLGTNLVEYLSAVTNAFHRMEIEAALKIFNRIAAVGLGLIALRFGHVAPVLVALAAATLISSMLALIAVRRQLVRVSLMFDWPLVKRLAWMGLPIAGTLVVGTIYLKWDLLVLSYFKISKEQIGWYAGAFEIVEAFSALPSLLGAALFPLMVQLRDSNADAMDRLLNTTTKAVLLFAIPVAATVSLFSRHIIGIIYGSAYLPAATILAVLIWCIVPMFIYFYLMFVNVASGHARQNLFAGTIALVVGMSANALLVPRMGYIGAAWAALAANTSYALVATWRVCQSFRHARLPRTVLQVLAAGILMALAGFYLPLPIGFQFIAGMAVFLAALLVTGALSGDDLALMMRMIQMRTQPKVQEL